MRMICGCCAPPATGRLGSLSGMCLTALFYAAAPETARIVQHNPALRNKIAELVAQNRPVLQALGRRNLRPDEQKLASWIFRLFSKSFKPGAAESWPLFLPAQRHGLEHGWLLHLLDITVE